MKELKPCPFCGGKAEARWVNKTKGNFGYAFIECQKCFAIPHTHLVYVGLDKEEATESVIEKWNRRV